MQQKKCENYVHRQLFVEVWKIVTLALPILIAQIAQVSVGFVDTVMAGRAGIEDLSAVALGSNIFVTVYVTFIGIMAALNPILSQLFGAGETHQIGEYGRQGLWFGLGIGLIGMILIWLMINPMKSHFHLGEYVEDTFALYLWFIGLGMPAAMLHRALHAYTSALNRPRLIMVVSILALLLNIPLNYAFIYGKWGMPALGGAGCGVASALVFWFNALALAIYIAYQRYFTPFGLWKKFSWPNWQIQRQFLQLGMPIGLSFFLEVSLFTFIGLLIVPFGVLQVDTQQILANITTIIYMLPQSIGIALCIRVGQTIGVGDMRFARYVSWVGIGLGVLVAFLTAALLLLTRHHLATIYTTNQMIIQQVAGLLLFAAIFQISDAIQTISSYALRGYKLSKIPVVIHAISFWVLGLGLGSFMGIVLGWGLYGFWGALVIALSSAAVALVYYLNRISYRLIERQEYYERHT